MNSLDLFAPATEANSIVSFVNNEAHRIWDTTEAHRKRSIAQVQRFVNYDD